MQNFLELIVRHLVDKPEEVRVKTIIGERLTIYELRVGSGDFGKVIGKGGQNVRAIRILLSAASKKTGRSSLLEVLE